VVVTDLRKLVTKAGIWSDAASVGVVSDVIELMPFPLGLIVVSDTVWDTKLTCTTLSIM